MIFSCTSVFAQLHVAPSATSDSYIYAKDRMLFVKNHISLSENRNSQTEASIYLRKDSQLLQGDKAVNNNSGTGKISVYQEGTSNAYDYNYWGLPVKINPKNNSLLNDYIFEPIGKTDSRKSKLTNGLDGISFPLNISSRWIYFFAGTNYSNWGYAGNHFDPFPGQGFTMKGVNGINQNMIEDRMINTGSSQTYDFRGIPNDGNIEMNISKDQILLIGNPYPSALDLNKFLIENTNSTGIAYFWDSRENGNSHYLADYEGGYGTYSAGTGLYAPAIFKNYGTWNETGNSGKYYSRGISPIAQGFMIIGKNEGKILFRNTHRIYQKEKDGISVFKTSEKAVPSLRLNIEIDSQYVRQLILGLHKKATTAEDHAMDARMFNKVDNDVSWEIDQEDFIINVRPKVDKELIPLHVQLNKPTQVKFYIGELAEFDPYRIFIFDAAENLYYGIKTGYLKLQLPEGDYRNRFYLSFLDKAPENPNSNPPKPDVIPVKPRNILLNTIDIFQNNTMEQLEVKMLYDSDFRNIRLYNLNGKLIFEKDFKSSQKEFNIPTGGLSTAVYIVKVKTGDNKELTKKVGIKN